jgi:hypothetical protein
MKKTQQINSRDGFDLSENRNIYNPFQSTVSINFVSESDFLQKIETLKSLVLEKNLVIISCPTIKVSLNGLSVGSAGFTF